MAHGLLVSISPKYDKSAAPCDRTFVPHTHLLLFGTCSYPDIHTIRPNGDLFITDTDTGRTRNLFLPEQAGNTYVSPDGRMIARNVGNHIDILGIDGQPIRLNLVTYTESQPMQLSPMVYWTSDLARADHASPH